MIVVHTNEASKIEMEKFYVRADQLQSVGTDLLNAVSALRIYHVSSQLF